MRYLLTILAAAALCAQQPARTAVDGLRMEEFKAHIRGLAQFGDRTAGSAGNREAVAWLEQQLRSYGYTNVVRHRFNSSRGPLENVYATKVGSDTPGEMYLVSAHMDGRGGGEAADDDASGCAVVLELARVLAGVRTNRSVRFIFWNNEEFGMDGSGTYVTERFPLQGTADEPKWLGIIQHDMMLYDHGMPPGAKQAAKADINVEYQARSAKAVDSARLTAALKTSNEVYARSYPVTIGVNMDGTDSIRFQDRVASVSVREAERVTGIVRGSNPNHHEPTDKFENYTEEDFELGFDAARTTLGALGALVGIR
jgi:hypothetical protein